MNDFTASNGVRIRVDSEGDYRFGGTARTADYFIHQGGANEQALREFFQAEADERLGRWRVPAAPNWLCYATGRPYEVVVFNENEPTNGTFTLSRGEDTWPYARPAANAYFDAHPEPKPWHDAEPGQMWLLTFADESSVPAVTSSSASGHVIFTAATEQAGGTQEFAINSVYITAGRRIWPEVS